MKINLKILKRIIILTLPIWCIILANILASAHLKHFCLIKLITNIECWGCGMTRAVAALSQFDFRGAYEFNHGIIIVVPVMFLLWGIIIYYEFRDKK